MFCKLKNIIGRAALLTAFCLPAFVMAQSATIALPTTPQAWSQAAINDVKAASQITAENHPGFVDPANPAFKGLLTQAERNGLELAARVTDASGYVAAIRRFSNTLQDGHAGAFPTIDSADLPKSRWPGFVVVWRGNEALVYNSVAGGPARGARIMDCDGASIETLANTNVFAFRGRPSEPGNWWVEVRRVFIDTGNPFITLPRKCRFQVEGRTFEQELTWRETDATFNQWRDDSYNGVTLPVGMSTRASGIVWIAMPNFQPDTAEQASYRDIVSRITAQRSAISSAPAIVLDLRDNQGGSSVWSKMIADALWGNVLRNRLMARYNGRGGLIKWRTSNGNARHVEALIPGFREQGLNDIAADWTAIYQGMDAARLRGEVFYTEGSGTAGNARKAPRRSGEAVSPLLAPVYVIVPGQCASACLDAVDVFTRFEHVKLIGAPSSADSTYMDIRRQALPSGLGAVVIPNKVYVGRPRGPGFAYRPAIEVRDLDWSTQAFEDVVMRDIAGRTHPVSQRTSRAP
jgi:hypothetical protein